MALVALAAGAVAGYLLLIPVTKVDDALLARLVVSSPGAGLGARPSTRGPLAQGQIPFPVARQAARRQPERAGAYSAEWTGKGPAVTGAGVFLALLPTAAQAGEVRAQAASQYLDAATLGRQGYKVRQRFTVPGVPGATGDTFSSATGAKTTTAAVVVPYQRALTVIFAEGQPATARARAVTLGRREAALLRRQLPGFSLVATSVPVLASVVYWVVAAVVIVAVAAGPGGVERRRRRREAARLEAMRRERLVRGKKVARRQAGASKPRSSGLRRR